MKKTLLVIALIITAIVSSKNNSGKEYLDVEKSKICKSYIGQIFSKPIGIIQNYKNEDGLTYVRYTRSSDSTRWSYVCDISNDQIVWAAWLNDSNKWGRWRQEDKTNLTYDKDKNEVSFKLKGRSNITRVTL
ncbi:hypothetical protein [Vibrio campbellii]|uniref:Uncharacterized protein n=1 Tax=Vibrio campbellii (strain ATCC BAA-1116) TaxID=2902295 RepID=A7MYN5_VIBC1|nr:hypothetical protein [Vibrio campbellii]ABU70897.1 hypothetical protein VIBHAR_01932 [Vibrio campbellii ATCC BAA-1116]AGU96197.1 hypothetical protein M892_03560 [Vibrio campbellii ATCC BAA-1116]MBT0124681.1 hypothetical protein [Vibrio campbellii]MBT0139593.1 hypothetical protein [Vibrio campbellii]MBT0144279.1 hypothetical protein [Vibrio campbellii]